MWKGNVNDLPEISLEHVAWSEESWNYGNSRAIAVSVVDPDTGYDITRAMAYYDTHETIEPPRTTTRIVHFDIDGGSYDVEVTILLFGGVRRELSTEEVEASKETARQGCIQYLRFCARAAQLLSVKEPK